MGKASTRSLFLAGLVDPAPFVALALAEGAYRPGYDPVRQYVSLLSLGDGVWLQQANFIVSGVLIAAFGLLQRVAIIAGFQWLVATALIELGHLGRTTSRAFG